MIGITFTTRFVIQYIFSTFSIFWNTLTPQDKSSHQVMVAARGRGGEGMIRRFAANLQGASRTP
jgi:hypothetical protein